MEQQPTTTTAAVPPPATTSKYSAQRPAGREHIPLYPKAFITVRILQLIVAIACLGLSGWAIAYLVFAGDALTLFTSIVTVITSIYCIVARFGPPKAYNYWAILALDIFLLIFWLISFAVLAAQVAATWTYNDDYFDYYSDYDDYFGYYYDYSSTLTIYLAALAAAAGLGALEFILYIVSLSIHSVRLHRHRKAGLHSKPLSGPSLAAAAPGQVGGEKIQMQPQQPQQPPQAYPAPQPYPQQTYPQQPQQTYQPASAPYGQDQNSFQPQNVYATQQPPQPQPQPQPNPYPQHPIASPVPSQNTGGSYVQGPTVSLSSSQPIYEAAGDDRQRQQQQQQQQQQQHQYQ